MADVETEVNSDSREYALGWTDAIAWLDWTRPTRTGAQRRADEFERLAQDALVANVTAIREYFAGYVDLLREAIRACETRLKHKRTRPGRGNGRLPVPVASFCALGVPSCQARCRP